MFCKLLITFLLIFSISENSNANASILRTSRHPRIIGGTPATMGQMPYQVSVEQKPYGMHYCGGSVLNKRYVLSAAHCFSVMNLTAPDIQVWVGGVNLDEADFVGRTVDVQEIIEHDYDPVTRVNDIAVLKLAEDLPFSDTINKIELAETPADPGSACRVAGWGYTKENGEINSDLLYTDVIITDHEVCKNNYQAIFKVTDKMICAGYEDEPKDACTGDSGGPLVYDNKLVGVVSLGNGCGRKNYPGIYTDVTKYIDWINSSTRASSNSIS